MTKVWVVSEVLHDYDGPYVSMRLFSSEELADKYMEDNATYNNGYCDMRRYWDTDVITLDAEDWLVKYA